MTTLRILVLSYTAFASEPRALKQVTFLRDQHRVSTAGFGDLHLDGVTHTALAQQPAQRWGIVGRVAHLAALAVRAHRLVSWLSARDREVVSRLGVEQWDVVIAHDLWSLEAALALEPRCGVVLDLHEYAPAEATHSLAWRLAMKPYVAWLLRTKAPLAAEIVTVGEGIADRYRAEWGLDARVVTNATPFADLTPTPPHAPLRLVHSGVAAPERRLELMIDAVRTTRARATLDLYLVDNGSGELQRLRDVAGGDDRIRFREPVPYSRLVETLNDYDLGLSIFPPVTYNLEWCLPNKFFDFVQARLGVVVGPSPEMARVVSAHGLGVVLPDFSATSLAERLDDVSREQVVAWKAAAHAAAQELSSAPQRAVWEDLIREVERRSTA